MLTRKLNLYIDSLSVDRHCSDVVTSAFVNWIDLSHMSFNS